MAMIFNENIDLNKFKQEVNFEIIKKLDEYISNNIIKEDLKYYIDDLILNFFEWGMKIDENEPEDEDVLPQRIFEFFYEKENELFKGILQNKNFREEIKDIFCSNFLKLFIHLEDDEYEDEDDLLEDEDNYEEKIEGEYTIKNIYFFNSKKIAKIQYYKKELLHRDDDQPAEISYYKNGNIRSEKYYKDNLLHRDDDKPSLINYYNNNIKSDEFYYKFGKKHRDNDKPALIGYFENQKVMEEGWYQEDKSYRDNDKPNYILYNEDGEIEQENN